MWPAPSGQACWLCPREGPAKRMRSWTPASRGRYRPSSLSLWCPRGQKASVPTRNQLGLTAVHRARSLSASCCPPDPPARVLPSAQGLNLVPGTVAVVPRPPSSCMAPPPNTPTPRASRGGPGEGDAAPLNEAPAPFRAECTAPGTRARWCGALGHTSVWSPATCGGGAPRSPRSPGPPSAAAPQQHFLWGRGADPAIWVGSPRGPFSSSSFCQESPRFCAGGGRSDSERGCVAAAAAGWGETAPLPRQATWGGHWPRGQRGQAFQATAVWGGSRRCWSLGAERARGPQEAL